MYQVEMTPVVKTEIRPVPDIKSLEKLYNVFLDKGVHFRVEQLNDEQISFYWTRSNEYLYDCIAKEISEILAPVTGKVNAWAESVEDEQPEIDAQPTNKEKPVCEPRFINYVGHDVDIIDETLRLFFPTNVETKNEGNHLTIKYWSIDNTFEETIRGLIREIGNNRVRLLSIRGIDQEDADTFMRDIVHMYREKIRQSVYKDETLSILVDYDPDLISSIAIRARLIVDPYIENARAAILESLFKVLNEDCNCPKCRNRY